MDTALSTDTREPNRIGAKVCPQRRRHVYREHTIHWQQGLQASTQRLDLAKRVCMNQGHLLKGKLLLEQGNQAIQRCLRGTDLLGCRYAIAHLQEGFICSHPQASLRPGSSSTPSEVFERIQHSNDVGAFPKVAQEGQDLRDSGAVCGNLRSRPG